MKKGILFGIIIGIITTTVVGVFADDILEATGIKYKKRTVEDALNELYIKANAKDVGALKFCKFVDGTYGSFGEIGSKYECEVGPNIKYNFYLLSKENGIVNLLMEKNLVDGISWYDAMAYFTDNENGIATRNSWSNVLSIDLPKIQDIIDATGKNERKASTYTTTWWCLGSGNQDSSSYYCSAETNAEYAWLFNHLNGCKTTGCTDDTYATVDGYWSRDLIRNANNAWNVYWMGVIDYDGVSNSSNDGIRPVITVLKTNLYSE